MNITGTETSSKTKVRIAIVGIGGVGGYYGGLLSKHAEENYNTEIIFLARGENLKIIQQSGLQVITEKDVFVTRPSIVTGDAAEAGVADFIILATKSYDLEVTAAQILPMVGPGTIILPLLNGITHTPRLRELYPENEIWYGSVYIVARLKEPGVIESSGGVHFFHFGHEKAISPALLMFEKILLDAGVEVARKDEPLKAIWRKFFYISPSASLTTYYNTGFRNLVWDEDKKPGYLAMMEELLAISKAESVNLYDNIIEDMLNYGGSLPAGTTSSMNTDFLAGRKTELENLTGDVVRLGQKHGIETPVYCRVYESLKQRMVGISGT